MEEIDVLKINGDDDDDYMYVMLNNKDQRTLVHKLMNNLMTQSAA